jgi:hypothetical protein
VIVCRLRGPFVRSAAVVKGPQKGVIMRTSSMTRALCAVAVVAAAAGGADATTYYVNGSCGSDAWVGTNPACVPPTGPKATIQAAIYATSGGDEIVVADGFYTGTGNIDLDFGGRSITLRSANGAESCVIDCQGGGRGFIFDSGESDSAVVQGFTIANGFAVVGGGLYVEGSGATVIDCVFTGNYAEVGGAIYGIECGNLTLIGCAFSGNTVLASVGGVFLGSACGTLTVVDCAFTDNDGGEACGALATDVPVVDLANCFFARNAGYFLGGAIAEASASMSAVNCAFSRNTSFRGGGIYTSSNLGLVNCTFSDNTGGAVMTDTNAFSFLANDVLWGNGMGEIVEDPDHPGGTAIVQFSDVEGGWPGAGNISANPLFVEPEADDVRLSMGSPCIDGGNNTALPPDEFDLDGDGNTSEPIPVDLDGNPRVAGIVVDMGAYEGGFEGVPVAASDDDVDQGEFVILVPEGGSLDPLEAAAVIVWNTSGPDNATFAVTQLGGDVHPGAGGYSEISDVLETETSLDDGQYLAMVYIPFSGASLAGIDPVEVNLTYYDHTIGNWALAVAGNTVNSPGFAGPIGDRDVSLDGGPWSLTVGVGDYGVYWDPAVQQGFAWANVDFEGDFGVGAALCPGDCLQSPDGDVGILDLLALLGGWGADGGGGPCDLDFDGVIGVVDFFALLGAWGTCPEPVSAPVAGPPQEIGAPRRMVRSADLDGNAVVDRRDLEVLRASWGDRTGDSLADLDGDGIVGTADLLSMLAAWQPE